MHTCCCDVSTHIHITYIPDASKPLVQLAALDCSSVPVLISLEVSRLYSRITATTVRRSCRVWSQQSLASVGRALYFRFVGGAAVVLLLL